MDKQELILQEQAALITGIVDLERARKEIEKQENMMREKLKDAMEEYGVVMIDNDALNVQYFPESTRETFDTARFRADYPETAEQYVKKSNVKANIRIRLK